MSTAGNSVLKFVCVTVHTVMGKESRPDDLLNAEEYHYTSVTIEHCAPRTRRRNYGAFDSCDFMLLTQN